MRVIIVQKTGQKLVLTKFGKHFCKVFVKVYSSVIKVSQLILESPELTF